MAIETEMSSTLSFRPLPWLSRWFRVYRAFVRNAFLDMLAYRMRYVTGILTYLLFVSVHYFIWSAVFDGQPEGAQLNGFTLHEMVTYIAVGWIARSLYFSNIDYDLDEIVKSGEISIYLIRPVNLQAVMIVRAFGELLFRATFFTLPVAIPIVVIFGVHPPVSLAALLLFILATAYSFLIFAAMNFVVGLWAFSLKSIRNIIQAKYYLVQLLSGLLIPLTFFPMWAGKLSLWLPFQALSYVPLQFYLGKISGPAILRTFLFETFWLALLLLWGHLAWRKGMRRLTIQGG